MYSTTDYLEYEYLCRKHIPLLKKEDGVFFFTKTPDLFLELFHYYYQLELRTEYDHTISALDYALTL